MGGGMGGGVSLFAKSLKPIREDTSPRLSKEGAGQFANSHPVKSSAQWSTAQSNRSRAIMKNNHGGRPYCFGLTETSKKTAV